MRRIATWKLISIKRSSGRAREALIRKRTTYHCPGVLVARSDCMYGQDHTSTVPEWRLGGAADAAAAALGACRRRVHRTLHAMRRLPERVPHRNSRKRTRRLSACVFRAGRMHFLRGVRGGVQTGGTRSGGGSATLAACCANRRHVPRAPGGGLPQLRRPLRSPRDPLPPRARRRGAAGARRRVVHGVWRMRRGLPRRRHLDV